MFLIEEAYQKYNLLFFCTTDNEYYEFAMLKYLNLLFITN